MGARRIKPDSHGLRVVVSIGTMKDRINTDMKNFKDHVSPIVETIVATLIADLIEKVLELILHG